jgi:hypothetical protein
LNMHTDTTAQGLFIGKHDESLEGLKPLPAEHRPPTSHNMAQVKLLFNTGSRIFFNRGFLPFLAPPGWVPCVKNSLQSVTNVTLRSLGQPGGNVKHVLHRGLSGPLA